MLTTKDGPLSAGALLTNFVEDERERFDTEDGNIIAAYAMQIAERVAYLEIVADDYEMANSTYRDSLARFRAATEAEWERLGEDRSSSRPATAEEQELSDKAGRDGLTVYLRIETFYVFAKVLFDLMAGFLPYYFGQAREVSLNKHSKVAEGLPNFVARKGLTPVPSSLSALIAEVDNRVAHYRNTTVVHGHSPRTYRGTIFYVNSGESMIATERLYPQKAETRKQSETPRTLLPLIESYVVEFVDYLKNNRDKADRLAPSLATVESAD